MTTQHTPQRLTVGVDLDETLYPFTQVMRAYIERRKGRSLPNHGDHLYSLGERWGLGAEAFTTLFRDAIIDGVCFDGAAPFPDVTDGLARIAAAGHRIVIVTARDVPGLVDEARAATEAWLTRWGVPHHDLILSHDKTVAGADVFLDDHPGHYDALEAAGCVAFLRDQPHNADHPGRRVRCVREFADRVDALAASAAGNPVVSGR